MANLSKTLQINFYQNRSSIVEVMIKKFGVFFMPHSVHLRQVLPDFRLLIKEVPAVFCSLVSTSYLFSRTIGAHYLFRYILSSVYPLIKLFCLHCYALQLSRRPFVVRISRCCIVVMLFKNSKYYKVLYPLFKQKSICHPERTEP